MFGTYRYFLAFSVVFNHFVHLLWGRPNWTGNYAVFSFFMISGYLMTRVLHESYGFGQNGLKRYLVNRALRLYPPYWLAVALSSVAIFLLPQLSREMLPSIGWPRGAVDWMATISILGLTADRLPRIVPLAWSLHVEACFYLMIPLLVRNLLVTRIWLVASCLLAIFMVVQDFNFVARYTSVLGASLPFALGASIYQRGPRPVPARLTVAAVAISAALMYGLYLPFWSLDVRLEGFYVYIAVTVFVVWGLANLDMAGAPHVVRRIDRHLGDLSYPIFLLHFPIGFLIMWLWHGKQSVTGWRFLVVAFPVIHLAAWAIHQTLEARVERLRTRIRGFARRF